MSMRATNGTIQMPLIGLGTWQYNDTVAQAAVTAAFSVGYRYHPMPHLNLTITTINCARSAHPIKRLPPSNCYLVLSFTLLVPTALCLGRHVDTALGYGNQRGVGRALAAAGVPRAEYFVTSKIPGSATPLPLISTPPTPTG